MKQLELFPDETFIEGDRVQFIKEGLGVPVKLGAEGTVISYEDETKCVFVDFDHYEGIGTFWCGNTFWCDDAQLQSL